MIELMISQFLSHLLPRIKSTTEIIVPMALALLYTIYIFQPINIVNADLGRHIKNGEIIVNEIKKIPAKTATWDILYSNYYSYTNTNEKFINHHWLTGVTFYLIKVNLGFAGLQIFNLLLVASIVLINYKSARKFASPATLLLSFILLLPLACYRTEIRPEMISYFFTSIFIWLLVNHKHDSRRLYLLPVIMLFWINLHIYFILGFIVFGIFIFTKIISSYQNKLELKRIILSNSKILLLTLIAGLGNPFFTTGLLFPLNIFTKYGYEVVENKSLLFLYNYGFRNSEIFLTWLISLVIILLITFTFVYKDRLLNSHLIKTDHLNFMTLLAIFLIFMASYAYRNSNLFGFFIAIPLAFFIQTILNLLTYQKPDQIKKNATILVTYLIILITWVYLFVFWQSIFNPSKYHIIDDNQDIFKNLQLKDNIFNNYDVGGYLIYNLFPKHKVFVDNRPEAYSTDFLQNIYIPMQLLDDEWQKYQTHYNINTVILAKNDITDWGRSIYRKIRVNPDWQIIYENADVIVLTKK